MRSSAPWRGCAFESLTTPRSVATESAYRCVETNHDTATIRNIRARVVMAQKYRFSGFCKTDRGRGPGVPAEGLEPTRSCDHWILSPARLPFRHAGVLESGAKEYELRAEAQTVPTKSSGCKLRGGPKISRRIIASRNPEVDLSRVAKSIFVSTDLEIGCV